VISKNIEIKKDWDVSFPIGDKHDKSPIVESKCMQALREFVFRKNTGSFLLSGQRGSGKTTSVTHIFNKIKKDSYLVISLNAMYIEAVSGDDYCHSLLQILRQLIRTLMKELIEKNYKISPEIMELNKDLLSTEVEWTNKSSLLRGKETMGNLSGSFSGDVKQLPIDLGVSGKAGVSKYKKKQTDVVKLNKTVGFSIEGLTDSFSQIIDDIEKGKLKINGVKRKLFGLIPRPVKDVEGTIDKVIFIFDELDLYDDKPEDILEILKKFKNLFTLSKAQFIFIVGEKTFEEVLKDSKFRTLFTEKYFLPKPQGDFLSKFLDSIVKNKEQVERNIEWEQLKWLIISFSEHNFHQLVQQVRSYTNYDCRKNKVKINIEKLSFQDGVQASAHYALNEIYKHHINNRSYRHCDNILFNELMSIEKNFLDWLHNKKDSPISLTPPSSSSVSRVEIRSKIRNAKISYLRYLYLLANTPIAVNFGEGVEEVKVNWSVLSLGLADFKTVMKGVSGPATANEYSLLKTIDKITDKLKTYLNFYKINIESEIKFHDLIRRASKVFGFNYSEEHLTSIEKTVQQINKKLLYERNLEETTSALGLIKNLDEEISKYNYLDQRDYIIKTDWGDVSIDESTSEIKLGVDPAHGNKLLSRFTIYTPKVEKKPLEIFYKVKIKQNSLINFLVNTKYLGFEKDDEFYMARVDSRENTSSYSLLLKPEGNPNWKVESNAPFADVSRIKVDSWVDIKVSIFKNKITLSRKAKRNFTKLVDCSLTKTIKTFGFANELGEVEIKDIRFK